MPALPASAKKEKPADARPGALAGRRLIGAWLGIVAALTTLVGLMLPYAAPRLALVLLPALVLLLAALAFLVATTAERGRHAAERERLLDENRRLAADLEALADTTWELHESEEREARRKAEASNAAKSRLLATVSHEFRTPLNGILGLTGLLLETRLTPDQETYIRGVHSSGEALLALVDDMLDYSRAEAGRFDLHPEVTGLETLLQGIVELLAARAHAKGIDIAVRMDDDVPAEVLVDAARLRQVLLNLAGNGVKFTDAGGVTLSAGRLDGAPQGAVRIEFAVADSGPGVPAAAAERIFGEFEQVDSALTRRHGGAGLGLAISRRIVRRMGGDIELRERPGGGAVFRFALDLSLPPSKLTAAPPPDLAGRRILIVAPPGAEPPILAETLAGAGASARVVGSAGEAAALAGAAAAAATPYHAVLIDQRVSPEAGKALALIREAGGAPLSAAVLIEPGGRTEIDDLRANGFDAYLVRPVRRSSLMRIAAEIVAAPGGFHIDPSDARPPRAERPAPAARSLNVLLAEDNEINALLVRAVLEGLGHAVSEVRDGLAAVAAATAADAHFAIVLMDLHMPRLDGLAAARLIRAHEARSGKSRMVIVALTADVLAETRAEAEAADIDAILAKPIAPDSLRRVLSDLADGETLTISEVANSK
jgi:signal transduction histidine kinase/CheY-like chemotaxis protein